MPWDFRKDGKMNLYGDSRRCSDIAYPNTCCHNVLLLTMILTSTFMYFCNTGTFYSCVHIVAIAIK